jgi:hypothetical protein
LPAAVANSTLRLRTSISTRLVYGESGRGDIQF